MLILEATISDLRSILELQYLAYQKEAEILDDYELDPLKETEEEIEEAFFNGVILKAIDDLGHIVGSVRAFKKEDTVFIERLIVDPNLTGNGIGSKLLDAAEKLLPSKRYEFFSSDIISHNLDFFRNNGYKEFKAEFIKPNVRAVYFEKLSTD
ncbi:MAG: GNAT family N-acetyltransferase [Methanobacteriaceae archaeon]|jgi:predicted N-acetyltransferase YhbS|uniref:GNAT family N-acetyltransferase n=1 Tax=unclassified Methanobrevibacter TaxID=2638681 RepID=UPI002A1299A2|nr:GNAT family N-acetyltransferase [Methanobacteriaceae archaeon]MDD3408253.1 GNAT family N-acetyltransferase [Methanobacteriaceae archaeon]MDD4593833.1 GNAT family N-acetyltransferase [Methanobacteriaceae archaeon]